MKKLLLVVTLAVLASSCAGWGKRDLTNNQMVFGDDPMTPEYKHVWYPRYNISIDPKIFKTLK